MVASLLPLALGAGLLFLVVTGDDKKKKNGLPGGVDAPPRCTIDQLDDSMPAPHKQATIALLNRADAQASTFMAAAKIAEINGYPKARECLLDEAARRPGEKVLPPGFDPQNPATWPAGFPGASGPLGAPPIPPGVPGAPPPPPPIPGVPPVPGAVPGVPAPFPTGPFIPPAGTPFPGIPGFPTEIDPSFLPGVLRPSAGQVIPPIIQPFPGFPDIPGIPGPGAGLPQPGFPLPGAPGFPPAPAVGFPFVIREGDRPFGLAKYYTGLGSRWQEITGPNPHLGPITGGVPPYVNWLTGVTITLPWNPGLKPLPPTGL